MKTNFTNELFRISDEYCNGHINLEEAIYKLELAGSAMTREQMKQVLINGGRNNVKEFKLRA